MLLGTASAERQSLAGQVERPLSETRLHRMKPATGPRSRWLFESENVRPADLTIPIRIAGEDDHLSCSARLR